MTDFVTRADLDAALERVGGWVGEKYAELDKRLAEMKSKTVTLSGVWTKDVPYPENALCSHQGSLWLSRVPDNTARPGNGSPAWRLAVKRGTGGVKDDSDAKS
jgi:hypothetical protein